MIIIASPVSSSPLSLSSPPHGHRPSRRRRPSLGSSYGIITEERAVFSYDKIRGLFSPALRTVNFLAVVGLFTVILFGVLMVRAGVIS